MMPPMLVCYPACPLKPRQVDADWQAEFAALEAIGVAVAVLAADHSLHGPATIAPETLIVWRGWMHDTEGYRAFEAAMQAQGYRLFTPLQEYLRAHHLPGWLPTLPDHTAPTTVVPVSHLDKLAALAAKRDQWPVFVKDYVKSAAGPDSLAHTPEELLALVAKIIARRGAVEGGICLRQAQKYVAGSERRFFIWHQNVWPHPDAPLEATALAKLSARHFWHPFYAVDVAQLTDGRWRVVEIGDAQVSDLKEWTPELFASYLKPSLQPHLA